MNRVLEPYKLGTLELRNRIVRSATVDPLGNPDGTVSDAQVELYKMLAKDKVGLIISAMAYVSADGDAGARQNGLSDDCFLPGHRCLADAVHRAGGKVICQINHAGAASVIDNPLCPSGVPSPYKNAPCREMTVADIDRVKENFVAAARRTKAAGYDGVQIHCAHGYLLSQFINPFFNHRTDAYGGNAENRFRFAAEVIEAVRAAVGPDYLVTIKINSNLEQGDETFLPDFLWMGRRCKALGVDAIEVSGCDFTPLGRKGFHNYYLDRAAALKKETGLTVILVGGVRSLADMDAVLDAGVDMVSLSRPFICEPDLVVRLENGQEKASCVSCSKCFILAAKYKPGAPRCILQVPKE